MNVNTWRTVFTAILTLTQNMAVYSKLLPNLFANFQPLFIISNF